MKKLMHAHHHMAWGMLVALFGVFFLIANLVPEQQAMLKFWPIFLIAAGVLKTLCKHSCKE